MRMQLVTLALAAAWATTSPAQTAAGSHNPATKDPTVKTVASAARGRNSFTAAQARGRIEKAGYTDVGKLTKDRSGVWQGTAIKDGAKVTVGLDYKGNVTTR